MKTEYFLPEISVSIRGKIFPSFTLAWVTGLFLSFVLSWIFFELLSLELLLLPLIFCSSILVLLLTAFAIKIVKGVEEHVMLRYMVVALLFHIYFLKSIDVSIYHYLDVLLLGYGVVICVGRLGCYKVGCCHGKPSSVGVHYTHKHVEKGFPEYYLGQKIFPIQLIEFGLLVIILSICYTLLLTSIPGTVGISFII